MKRDSVSAYVQMRRDKPLPLYAPVHILDDRPLHSPSKYLMAYFLTKKANKNIRISYSLKYKHSEKYSLRRNKWQCRMK